jgi:hypothetical protein
LYTDFGEYRKGIKLRVRGQRSVRHGLIITSSSNIIGALGGFVGVPAACALMARTRATILKSSGVIGYCAPILLAEVTGDAAHDFWWAKVESNSQRGLFGPFGPRHVLMSSLHKRWAVPPLSKTVNLRRPMLYKRWAQCCFPVLPRQYKA